LERALHYVRTHPWRWDEDTGLVKRPYTIDTWDFAYTAGVHDWLQFQIDERTYWGIMHGDNSGYYEAFRIMQRLYSLFGDDTKAQAWAERARALKTNLNRICWNGRFYTHFVKLTPVTIPGVDEDRQLSLSNPMAVNRGAAGHERAVSIIREYKERRNNGTSFAEWFSIDPPFPDGVFGDEKLAAGAYVNGGIFPLVGGELARAALEHGFEEYGIAILRRYFTLVAAKRESYLWYFPDGTPSSSETSTSPEASPTDGWGSSAMLFALMEGLAGIEDHDKLFRRVRLAPRWPAAGIKQARVRAEYAASQASLEYRYVRENQIIHIELLAPDVQVDCHIMVPKGTFPISVRVDGRDIPWRMTSVEHSLYVDLTTELCQDSVIEITLEKRP
jgi:hypothetical protein